MKRPAALVTALCLAIAPACKKDPEPAATTGGDAKAKTADGDPKAPAKPEGGTPAKPDAPAPTTPAPTAPPTLAPSYAAALDPLLELVPTGSEQFLVVRDVNEILDDTSWLLTAAAGPISRAIDLDKTPDEDFRRVVKDFGSIRSAFTDSGIDFDKGFVVVGNGPGSDVLLFASSDPEAFNKLGAKVSGKPSTMKCKALGDPAGFVACAEKDDGSVDKYTAGKSASTWRGELAKALPGVELEEANMLGRWRGDDGPDAIAISTAPGLLEVHVAAPLDPQFVKATAMGPAPALALTPTGGSFIWGRIDRDFMNEQTKTAPGIVGNVVKTMTGEYFFGALGKPGGIVALFGVDDPVPASGLVPMFSLVQDQVPTKLPDGTALKIGVEPVDVDGAAVQTVHAVADSPDKELIAKTGLVPEGLAFAAGKYMAVVLGADAKAVAEIAKLDPAAPATVLDVLPADMATALRDGKAALAVQLELDGLQNPELRALMMKAAERMPTDPGDPEPKQLVELGLALAAPLSSLSVWVTRHEGVPLVHVALRSFGDPASEEGKAAHAAVAEIDAGTRDAKTVYGELAARYPDSARAFAYRMRAEPTPTAVSAAFSGLFLAGVFAALVLGRKDASVSASPPTAVPGTK